MKQYFAFAIFITLLAFAQCLLAPIASAQSPTPSTVPSSFVTPSALPQPAGGAAQNLQVGTTSQPKQVSVTVVATNRKTGRLLGSVQIKIGEAGSQVTTPDPPPPGGYTMTSVPDGKQTVVAERFGYDRYAKEINLSSESGYFDLKIDLDPWPGTPDVSRLASQNNYWNSGNAWPSNVPQNYQNLSQSWGYGSWNNSAINSSNYPNYYGQNTYSPASYNQNWQNPTNSSWQNYPSPYSYPYAQPYQQNYTSPYASQYGNYQLSDQTINLDRVTDFRVARNNSDGNYYILLNQNSFTPRQLFFVDNGSGAGGLVFFSALPQALSSGYNLNQSQDWYVSLYSKNQLSEPTFVNNTFSKVAFSPYEYARVISGQLTSNFNQRLELNSAN